MKKIITVAVFGALSVGSMLASEIVKFVSLLQFLNAFLSIVNSLTLPGIVKFVSFVHLL